MKLNKAVLLNENKNEWLERGFKLPQFDFDAVKSNTLKKPRWIHFGAGNIFRAFPAVVLQKMLNSNETDTGIIAVEGFDFEIIDNIYRPHDNLSLVVTLNADGTIDKEVVASVVDSVVMDRSRVGDFERLKEIFRKDSLQMASFTITEKGYSVTDTKGEYHKAIADDFELGPYKAKTYMGQVASLCYERFKTSGAPIALVSMDNFSHNGEKLRYAITTFAAKWAEASFVPKSFCEYIEDDAKVSFPWSMIDKITPRPDAQVAESLLAEGFEDAEIVVTSKNTYIAPFVNAERAEYLVIEDNFPAERIALEKGGVKFAERKIVDKCDRMKVCSCLNPLHTALAVFGCLLSFNKIYEEMQDETLRKLVFDMGYKECLPVVDNPGIIEPNEFIKEVLYERIPNPFMPDTPQRIATDTSQKIPVRFGETIKSYLNSKNLNVKELKYIPLVLAGWCRYLMGVDDLGNTFTVSPDPLYEELKQYVKDIKIGDSGDFSSKLSPILSNSKIFGVNLEEIGIAQTVCEYFEEFVSEPGAVRKTLKKYVGI